MDAGRELEMPVRSKDLCEIQRLSQDEISRLSKGSSDKGVDKTRGCGPADFTFYGWLVPGPCASWEALTHGRLTRVP